MDYIFDTNIFLEILLDQRRKDTCKKLLNDFKGAIFISDFSVHSIGIILFKKEKFQSFSGFISDIANNATILTLPVISYPRITINAQKYHLDFDDSLQTSLAFEHNLGIITIDTDFKKVAKDLKVIFI